MNNNVFDFDKIELLEQMTDHLFEAQAQLRKQTWSMISAIIREVGEYEENGDISIRVSNSYQGAGVLIDNKWHQVSHVCLRHTDGTAVADNFEVYFKFVYDGKEINDIIDLENGGIDCFQTDIFGGSQKEEYWMLCKPTEFLYFLQDYMLAVLKYNESFNVVESESIVNEYYYGRTFPLP